MRDFKSDDVPAKSMFGNKLTRKIFKWLYRLDITDTQTGLRGIPAGFMSALVSIGGDRFEFETQMLIEAQKNNIVIREFPIATIYDSKESHSTHFHPILDSYRIYRIFFETFFKFAISSLSASVLDLFIFQIICWCMELVE